MAKNLKLTIKNTQIAEAINLGKLKSKIAANKALEDKEEKPVKKSALTKAPKAELNESTKNASAHSPAKEEATPRIRARSKSAFAEGSAPEAKPKVEFAETSRAGEAEDTEEEGIKVKKSSEELRKEIFAEELVELSEKKIFEEKPASEEAFSEAGKNEKPPTPAEESPLIAKALIPSREEKPVAVSRQEAPIPAIKPIPEYVKLGPTGRHVKDLLPRKPAPRPAYVPPQAPHKHKGEAASALDKEAAAKAAKDKFKPKEGEEVAVSDESLPKKTFPGKAKEFRDLKPTRRLEPTRAFDARDRQGLRADDDTSQWRKKRNRQIKQVQEDTTIRPTALKIRTPISIKDLAAEMKLKSSQLISKLFMQGLVVTLNDLLEDETTIQLLGHEFGCEISIDTSEEKRIRITDQSASEEIKQTSPEKLHIRAPVVAFMGHVDHGKTSLIDAIRSSNRAAGEAGAITQHIGAFKCQTAVGEICILDTPGHEAFSAMRARGADVTDIVVLVVAGDEGLRQQTVEAIQHAREAKVTIVVAINKCDKPNFNVENVYRQLAEQELLPEAWGGQTITVNCSAVTKEGINTLLEMLALQAEVLELRADPTNRARGRVLESEMHKGMGAMATMLIQNGTLKIGDSLVFDQYWGRVKTMQDEYGHNIQQAGPSTPVAITGLSGLPEAGQEFIVVKNEKEAREIAEARMVGMRQNNLLKKKLSMENLMMQASEPSKKILNIILRADVQGSLEALKVGLLKIYSKKAEVNIISAGVGEVSESDVQMAATSKAVIIGFHTQIESHADALIRQHGVQVKMHDIIYHAIDDAKAMLVDLLDKIAIETEKGKFQVKALFKSSHYGQIAGGIVTEGAINRNNQMRIIRNGQLIGKSSISSIKRVKDDVREVQKGLECGIVLSNFDTAQEGDVFEAYEVTYITQEL
ncbi:Translation initiation factor IF-2 [Neochlamydia sp. TUME1]|uniref:translation initiation factor IF-2 n=1 Tax=Neochlamydia sp. TUME1 TaxID=1478174 RepID=UPI00057D31E6|nr:translation initiation factor IF-2 [Neochlamydia sp. TUME1]KIC76752.1 Translation initiation factor IF-2 [Neochlamydia sp. TUME1]